MITASISLTLVLLVFFHFSSEVRMTFKQWCLTFCMFFPLVLFMLFSISVLDDERAYRDAVSIMRYTNR